MDKQNPTGKQILLLDLLFKTPANLYDLIREL